MESPTQPSPQSRHRSSSRIVAILLTLALVVSAFFVGQSSVPRSPNSAPATMPTARMKGKLYQCSMHPQIVSDKPGKCPICGMNLEPVEEAPTTVARKEHKILFYRNPMRADVMSPTPMKDEMGRGYIPIYAAQTATETEDRTH